LQSNQEFNARGEEGKRLCRSTARVIAEDAPMKDAVTARLVIEGGLGHTLGHRVTNKKEELRLGTSHGFRVRHEIRELSDASASLCGDELAAEQAGEGFFATLISLVLEDAVELRVNEEHGLLVAAVTVVVTCSFEQRTAPKSYGSRLRRIDVWDEAANFTPRFFVAPTPLQNG